MSDGLWAFYGHLDRRWDADPVRAGGPITTTRPQLRADVEVWRAMATQKRLAWPGPSSGAGDGALAAMAACEPPASPIRPPKRRAWMPGS